LSTLSTEQIAQKLNISKKTVENYLVMAKRSLRKSLVSGSFDGLFYDTTDEQTLKLKNLPGKQVQQTFEI
jgi:predicted DNA-binding protein (UPF0251 family)